MKIEIHKDTAIMVRAMSLVRGKRLSKKVNKNGVHRATELEEFLTPGRSATIKDLPAELYRELLSHMSPGQGVLLSLTCKYLWAKRHADDSDCLRKLRRETPRPERFKFLMLWEKDLPKYVLCHVCEKFERRRKSEASAIWESFGEKRDCTTAQGKVHIDCSPLTISPWTIYVHRRTLDLIIRASILGSRYGLPTTNLTQQWAREAYGVNALTIKVDLDARVVRAPDGDSHLFVRTRHLVEFDLHEDFEAQIAASRILPCAHVGSSMKEVATDALRSFKGDDGLSFESDIVRCDRCSTDVQVDISRDSHQSVFAATTMTAWRDLGPRGSHRNELWDHQCEMSAKKLDRRRYTFGTESLKAVWSRGWEST